MRNKADVNNDAIEASKPEPTKEQLLKEERSNLLRGLKLIAPIFLKLLDESVVGIKTAVTTRIAEIDVELAIG